MEERLNLVDGLRAPRVYGLVKAFGFGSLKP